MVALLLKLLLAPALVVASTLAGRRWGPGVTGALIAFPIIAGPVLLVTFLEHGRAFTHEAATAALLGLTSLATFSLVFARCGRRFPWTVSLSTAWATALAVDVGLSFLPPLTGIATGATTLVAIVLAIQLMPRTTVDDVTGAPQPPPGWDLPGRALATAILVVSVTTAAGILGPRWTGLLATFPVAASVVAAFALAQRGPTDAGRMLAGVLYGLFGFAGFCITVAQLVETLGAAAFLCGLGVAAAVQLAVVRARAALARASA